MFTNKFWTCLRIVAMTAARVVNAPARNDNRKDVRKNTRKHVRKHVRNRLVKIIIVSISAN